MNKKHLLLITVLLWLGACGQKGPLEVERPVTTQQQEPEETR